MQDSGHGVQTLLLDLFLFLGSEWILYVLLLLSVASIAITIERLWHFWQHREDHNAMYAWLQEQLAHRDTEALKAGLQVKRSYPAKVLLDGIQVLDKGEATVEEVLQASTQIARLQMERGISFLGTLGNNSPFIGLFGTVLGIIRAFRDLSMNTATGSSAVMAGIAEALIATAVGLLVALPAVAIYNLLQRRIRVQIQLLEAMGHMLLAYAKTKL